MVAGGCFCGKVRLEYNSEPVAKALCHCSDCRKVTGTLFSYNLVIKRGDLTITGSPKEITKTADTGNHHKNAFCPDCGTPLYGYRVNSDGTSADETMILRAGVFDDLEAVDERKPEIEIYSDRRTKWTSPVDGAHQVIGMPPLPS